MWCSKCHYGSEIYVGHVNRCPQCGTTADCVSDNPFPSRPIGMGSGASQEQKAQARRRKRDKAMEDALRDMSAEDRELLEMAM